jgi:glycosyltransferase involved in cell wall biosynthesis
MKLLFVNQHLGALGGAEANIQITAEELKSRGHVTGLLYASRTGRSEKAFHASFSESFCLPDQKPQEAALAAVNRFKPDVIYFHKLNDLQVMEALLDSGIPMVRMVHDHAMYCLREYKYNPFSRAICTRKASFFCVFPCLAPLARNRGGLLPFKWASYSARQNEMRLSKRCERVVVYSEYSKAELVQNGFDEEKITLHIPIRCWGKEGPVSSFGDRNLILFAGQIIRGKGVDLLLRALAKVTVNFEALILGDGSHRAYCEKLSQRLGLNQKVRFTGYVAPDEMKRYYLDASVFAVTSAWPEPFGMVGPEAMRYGLPVVAFDAGGIREWLTDGENGYLVPRMDTEQFAARLTELLRNKDLARRMGSNGLERVNSTYDSAKQVDGLENLFLELGAGRPGVRRWNEPALPNPANALPPMNFLKRPTTTIPATNI